MDNAYVLCRPPGHHAEPDQARGFCLFNNAAIAAAHSLQRHHLQRVAIVDFDVHHGNDTEKAFYSSCSVLFVSIHQDGLYPPNSGAISRNGEGEGLGLNINVSVPPGSGIGCYDAILKRVVLPALAAFDPEFIIISAGFDACSFDPLSHTMLSSGSYYRMTSEIADAASRSAACRGRVLAVHEGGYSEVYAPYCFLRAVEGLVGIHPVDSAVADPYEPEVVQYPYQDLQPAQEAVISAAESLLANIHS